MTDLPHYHGFTGTQNGMSTVQRHILARIVGGYELRRWHYRCCAGADLVRLDVSPHHPLSPTREHLLPRSLSCGKREPNNLVLAHRRCNNRRGTIDADAFLRLMHAEALTAKELWPEEDILPDET